MRVKSFMLIFVCVFMFAMSAFAQSRGYFTANAINVVGSGNDRVNIYDKLALVSYEHQKQNNNIWVQTKYENFILGGDDNSKGSFNDNAGGLSFGYGKELQENISAGFFGKYDSHSASQGNSAADINSYGIGVYGGYLYDDFDFKGIFSLSGQQYSISRDAGTGSAARSDFNGHDINVDLEAAYWIKASDTINVRPYLGLNLGYTGYGSSEEAGAGAADLDTESGSFSRNSMRFGAGVNGKHEKFGWHGGLECEYIISGKYVEIENKISASNIAVTSKGAEISSAVIGASAGGDYDISANVKAYANLGYKAAGGLSDFTANLGLAFVFNSF